MHIISIYEIYDMYDDYDVDEGNEIMPVTSYIGTLKRIIFVSK